MKNGYPYHAALEYNYITDGIYIGTNQCCQTHFDKTLLKQGVSAGISLEENRVDQPFGISVYLWLPTKDHAPPSMNQMEIGVATIEKLVSQGRKTYIHCKNGHGRAPTLVAAYLIKNRKMTPEEALIFIKSKRPEIHLQKSQRKALQRFYETIKNSKSNG